MCMVRRENRNFILDGVTVLQYLLDTVREVWLREFKSF